jgi:hypothetical protein
MWAAVVAAIGLSGAGAALAGAPTTNKQGFFIDLNVKATPPIAGTTKHPRGVGSNSTPSPATGLMATAW